MPDTLLGAGMCICKLRNFCNLSNQTAISAIRLQSQQSDCNLSNQKKTPPNMPESLCRVGAPYVSCGTFAISAIGLQSQQSDCNPPELQLDYKD